MNNESHKIGTEFKFQNRENPTYDQLKCRQEEIIKDFCHEYTGNFQMIKKDVLDFAFKRLKLKRIAELGCVWGVEGAYGRYISEKFDVEKIVMVDAIWNDPTIQKCQQYKNIEIVDGNFGEVAIAKTVGNVDAIIFFDILLHMVNPDWDQMLQMYSEQTSCFLIVNPQYLASKITMRLWDLEKNIYFESVPHNPSQKSYARAFANPYKYDEMQKKILRDASYIWQWGITNHDMIDKMDRLGFEPILLKKGDIYYGKRRDFVDYAFVFVKRSEIKNISI